MGDNKKKREKGPDDTTVVWEKNDGGFRIAKVIENSHYQYTVAALLSFALLMIYRKQINDLNSSNKLRKTPGTCGGSRIVSRDSSCYLSRARVSASPSLVRASHFAIKVQAEYAKQLFHRIAYSDSAIAIRECKTLFTNRFIIGSNYSKLYIYVYQEDNFLINISRQIYIYAIKNRWKFCIIFFIKLLFVKKFFAMIKKIDDVLWGWLRINIK